MKNSLLVITVLSCMLFACNKDNNNDDDNSGPQSYVVTLQPGVSNGIDALIEDYPYNNYRNKNWGDYDCFMAKSWTASGAPLVIRSFIDFNFDTIPVNAIIDSARLSLYAYGNDNQGYGHDTLSGSNACYLQRVINYWLEHGVTWNTQPMTTEENMLLIPKSHTTMQDYTNLDMTALVRDTYNNPDESFGFMIRLKDEVDYRQMTFGSSDAENPSRRPKLVIYYTVY